MCTGHYKSVFLFWKLILQGPLKHRTCIFFNIILWQLFSSRTFFILIWKWIDFLQISFRPYQWLIGELHHRMPKSVCNLSDKRLQVVGRCRILFYSVSFVKTSLIVSCNRMTNSAVPAPSLSQAQPYPLNSPAPWYFLSLVSGSKTRNIYTLKYRGISKGI